MMLVITTSKESLGYGRSVIEPTRKSTARPCVSASRCATAIILGERSMPCTVQPGYCAAILSAIIPVPQPASSKHSPPSNAASSSTC